MPIRGGNANKALLSRALIALFAAVTFIGVATAQEVARIATGSVPGAYHQIGSALGLSLDLRSGLASDVVATQGSIENIQRLREDQADFGFIQSALQVDLEGLSAVANIDVQYVHVVVPADSSARALSDLAGKRVHLGPDGGGAAELGQKLLDFCNYSPAVEVVHGPAEELPVAFAEGRVDAAVLVYSLFAPYVEILLAEGEYRLIPIVEAEAFARYLPGSRHLPIPPYSYGPNRSIPRDVADGQTVAVDTLLIARQEADPDMVRAVLDSLYSVEVIKAAQLDYLDEARGQHVRDLSLHPAAEAYYRRNDPITADSFEIASFFLAGMIAVASIAHYSLSRLDQRRLRRRQKRIEPYFERLLNIAEQVETSQDIDEITHHLHDMMETQREAEREWLKGRLDTEHMENLYAIYRARTGNTFNRIFMLQNAQLLKK